MDKMMIIIGNHTLACSTADEIVNQITDISGESVVDFFFEAHSNKKAGRSTKAQGIFVMPHVDEKYVNSNDQFSKEGFVSFRGILSDKVFQIDIGIEYFRLFTGISWRWYQMTEDIHPEIRNFSFRFLSKLGSSEYILFPDLPSISEFVSGKIDIGTYQEPPIDLEKIDPLPSSSFVLNCTNKQLTFNQIKYRLLKFMGKPAPRWAELVFNEEYAYLLEKVASKLEYWSTNA